ncbi:recombinase family protein [Falsiroseomonas sp. E2-1-a4]|uniref:recombinase family protein n=1 Tax=Falsiroseomonas sp. E2-1-a4 TaxID=3239299 RepID=UPI003F3E1E03
MWHRQAGPTKFTLHPTGSVLRTGETSRSLLRETEQGRVDVIVVYKIDRLSHSLMEFAKFVVVTEAHGVTFVSVTHSFERPPAVRVQWRLPQHDRRERD